MPLTDPLKRKEYARLSMAIKKAQELGQDANELIKQRNKLLGINGIKSIKSESINDGIKRGIKKESIKHSFIPDKYKLIEPELISNLYTEIQKNNELIQQLLTQKEPCLSYAELSQELAKFRTEILTQLTKKEAVVSEILTKTKPPQPTQKLTIIKEIPINKPLNSTTSPTQITLFISNELLPNIQTLLQQNPSLFPSFSHFLREALITYQNGLPLSTKSFSSSKKLSTKKNIRLDSELESLYRQLPEGQKTQTLNQILASFLEKNNG